MQRAWVYKVNLAVVVVSGILVLVGCAAVNFSANYYKPPEKYQAEVKKLWGQYLSYAALANEYKLDIVTDRDVRNGSPLIEQTTVKIPDNFIKYVYQNYYESRFKVLLCVASHEICHSEYRLYDQSNPKAHFVVDQRAIELVKAKTTCTDADYYNSLRVVKDYWFARKGVGGHMLNAGWNLSCVASMYYGGPGYFRDWYATDLSARLGLIARQYKIKRGSRFKRSNGDNKKISLEDDGLGRIFLAKK